MGLQYEVRSLVPELCSRIKRVFYMSNDGQNLLHEVFPAPNPAVLEQLSNVDCIVLIGTGEIISSMSCPKVLLLNGTHDRETSGFSASCFVTAITDALNRTYGDHHNCLKNLIFVNSIRDPNVGVVFDAKSLIEALADVVGKHMSTNVAVT
ncbi:hypothetical protein TorRG33x02_351040 [Trema orientale]|uniref:Uncharacterized protein n=1 Tax=Trema orientale TaxID=63057 RepID=A0A2P5AGE6_TREOI|nr:hypothetical protein TorRG33x02_351040 [Trema orientale]